MAKVKDKYLCDYCRNEVTGLPKQFLALQKEHWCNLQCKFDSEKRTYPVAGEADNKLCTN